MCHTLKKTKRHYIKDFPPILIRTSVRDKAAPSGELEGGLCGLTEPLLWIQLVAEGSLSSQRAFGVAMAKARRDNVEGSVFQ